METKLNDNCPLDRELDTDELENVSGGSPALPGLSNMVSKMVGDKLSIKLLANRITLFRQVRSPDENGKHRTRERTARQW
jgi:hypothetical protein